MRKFLSYETIANTNSGEFIKHIKTVRITEEDSNAFYMVFIENEELLTELTATQRRVLSEFCRLMVAGNRLILVSSVKEDVCKKLEISKASLYNCMHILKLAGIIVGKNNEYTVNPYIFWKGSLKDRYELITMINEKEGV